MKLEQIIILAFILAATSYGVEIVQTIKASQRANKRLEIAKKQGWVVEARLIESKIVDKSRLEDYEDNLSQLMKVSVYEYTINEKTKRIEITEDLSFPLLKEVYYDAENNNKVLNVSENSNTKIMLLIPIVVFVVTVLVLKMIFGV